VNLFFVLTDFVTVDRHFESTRRFKTLSVQEISSRQLRQAQLGLACSVVRSNPLREISPRVSLCRRGARGSSGQSDLRTGADVQISDGVHISDVSQAMIGFALTRL
jgi:hypothetical protein